MTELERLKAQIEVLDKAHDKARAELCRAEIRAWALGMAKAKAVKD